MSSSVPSDRSYVNIDISALFKDFNEIWHECSQSQWPLLKRFTRSEVKGQRSCVYKCVKFVNGLTVEACIPMVWTVV